MKKIIIYFTIFIVLLLGIYLVSTSSPKENKSKEVKDFVEMRGVFLSYIELQSLLKNKSKEEKEKSLDLVLKNMTDFKLNNLYIQVRPFADAIYKSEIFKPSLVITNSEDDEIDLDILSYVIKKAHENKILVHAWINPYRIRTNSDITSISKNAAFYDWLDDNRNIEISDQGIYFNPASMEVRTLILNGVKEIVENYEVDGIIYDDYFYPSKTIDLLEYESYKSTDSEISIEQYRINNINLLIKETYQVVKDISKDVLFGISPAGSITNNLENEYLDVAYILSKENYLDYIMPQLYYGFFNSSQPYVATLNTWNELITNNQTKLYVALSAYKSGLEDSYAGAGKEEWKENSDILTKQIIISRNQSKYQGFSLYRYDYLFDLKKENEVLAKEINNLKMIID